MFLHLLADVRSTETWGIGHLVAVLAVVVLIAYVVGMVRVRRRR